MMMVIITFAYLHVLSSNINGNCEFKFFANSLDLLVNHNILLKCCYIQTSL